MLQRVMIGLPSRYPCPIDHDSAIFHDDIGPLIWPCFRDAPLLQKMTAKTIRVPTIAAVFRSISRLLCTSFRAL
jgi:hypothetical protein